MATTPKNDIDNITLIEQFFENHYKSSLLRDEYGFIYRSLGTGVKLCCSKSEQDNIIAFADIISKIPKYDVQNPDNNITIRDIFFVLIYILYMLSYAEQGASANWVHGNVFKMYVDQFKGNLTKMHELYIELTTQDIMVKSPTGEMINLSSKVRESFLELKGGKKRTTYKNMRRKSRKLRKFKKLRKLRKSRKSRKYK